MQLEDICDVAEKLLNKAQAIFQEDGFLEPVLFQLNETTSEKSITPIMVTDERDSSFNAEKVSQLMKDLKDESEALILVVDASLNWVEDKEVGEVYKALFVVIHTPDISVTRERVYVKEGKKYSFSDQGWKTLNLCETFYRNPYNQKEVVKAL